MIAVPITLRDAREYVRRVHRHHRPPQGGLFAVAACASADAEICGVAIVGRPVARKLDNGWTAEVTRLATDGTKNACSFLYAASWRAARALGYKRLVTYVLASEPGKSVAAAGWKLVGEAGGGSWSRAERPRIDAHPTQRKMRFEATI